MTSRSISAHPSVRYADAVCKGRIIAPIYVQHQCREYLRVARGKDPTYKVDAQRLGKIDKLLGLMVLPKGLKAGHSIRETYAGYQWLLTAAVLCVVRRDDPRTRRYTSAVLEIARKNFKTYTVAVLFLLLLLLEPDYSRLFSVAADGSLSRLVKEAIEEILSASPALKPPEEPGRNFKIRRDDILCRLNSNRYVPLNYSNSRLDGRLPSVFLVDEAGALPNNYAIEAMRSGQLTVRNKLGFVISTKYPTPHNPFESEVSYAKSVLDGSIKDDTLFALLYEPDNPEAWRTDETVLLHANPVAQEIPEIWEDLQARWQKAIAQDSARENFLCKHCNIMYQGSVAETYIQVPAVQACRRDAIDWRGREVYLGMDLALTTDNCAVAMVADDGGTILAHVMAFVPADRIEDKNAAERINYYEHIRAGTCIACGGQVISYAAIEDYIMGIEDRYGVTVMGIAFDRYNAMSTAEKLGEKYNMVMVRQHSDTLHPPTKLLAEKVAEGEFGYMANDLLEINFGNARCTYDTNMNRYVTKKRSAGKVDMVVALINAVYLLQQEVYLNEIEFAVQY